jgi:hypothetical protein
MINNEINLFYIFILINMSEFKFQKWFDNFQHSFEIPTKFRNFELLNGFKLI